MEKILVSACLLGEKVRYDGAGKTLSHDIWQKWQDEKAEWYKEAKRKAAAEKK